MVSMLFAFRKLYAKFAPTEGGTSDDRSKGEGSDLILKNNYNLCFSLPEANVSHPVSVRIETIDTNLVVPVTIRPASV